MVNLSKWQECISDSTMRSFFNLTQSLNFTRSTKVPGGFLIVNHTIWGQTLILDWGTRLRAVVEPLDLCKAVNMGLTVPGLSIPPSHTQCHCQRLLRAVSPSSRQPPSQYLVSWSPSTNRHRRPLMAMTWTCSVCGSNLLSDPFSSPERTSLLLILCDFVLFLPPRSFVHTLCADDPISPPEEFLSGISPWNDRLTAAQCHTCMDSIVSQIGLWTFFGGGGRKKWK